jgi:HJR/Mrr/RecB family endonuclease
MKKIYISSSFKDVDDFTTFTLKRDLVGMGYEVVNEEKNEILFDDSKASPEYGISKADFFIAIVKDKNPFVFYELGYATALGKKVLIISESEYDLPFPLSKYNYIRFDSGVYNSVYGVINFIEKTKFEENALKGDIANFEDFVSSIQKNSQVIDRVSGLEFEELIFSYFKRIGAMIQKPASASEYGYDFILTDWKGHSKTIVEVKKYNKNSKVSVNSIQQLLGAMNVYESDHAIIITTSEFTASAKEFAGSLTKEIELWDINYLTHNLLLQS